MLVALGAALLSMRGWPAQPVSPYKTEAVQKGALTVSVTATGELKPVTQAAQQAADLSLQLYTAGLRDFRDVLDSQRALLTLQDSLASSVATVSSDLVRLFRALGGGWSAASLLPGSVTGP